MTEYCNLIGPTLSNNCCKQSTSLFVEPGVWPARLCPHVNFTFLSLCDNCATCRLLGVHGVSFVPLSDATGTSQLVCDFKVLYHHDRSLISHPYPALCHLWHGKLGQDLGMRLPNLSIKCPNDLPNWVCECMKTFVNHS